jgi:hypothetical protein
MTKGKLSYSMFMAASHELLGRDPGIVLPKLGV